MNNPYSAAQWSQLDALGTRLDELMRRQGLGLTMGAEPTYVLANSSHDPQWSTEADGAEKWALGKHLAERLQQRFAPQGVLQHGQGKWYPGEDLPRWALRCLWLAQQPLPEGPISDGPALFLQRLCDALGLPVEHVRTCRSQPAHVLVMGYCSRRGWISAAWPEELDLVGSQGPVGMRLPWSDLPSEHEVSRIGTALCVEPTEHGMAVFLPPLASTAAWLQLLETVRSCGAGLELRGYAPPLPGLHDEGLPGLRVLSVTPDPGVLEVNLHPAASWTELVDIVLGVDQEARACGLISHRFWRDGSLTGTGGGCHLVVGGPSPSLSPFAHRPDLLRSILVFWNRHPALSYFFAGLFVGPTSQAPRVDEARHDTLYELELAFRELDCEEGMEPAMLGRIFRDLLVDVSGNGHRCEICVDKLFDPLAPGGQQGLLEFRAFEMGPEPHMNLAVMLLLRALLWRLWTHPESGPLRRYGTELHDRYMLPAFLWLDLLDLLEDLRQHGVHLQSAWFQPHFEFRFPLLGACLCQGVRLELRSALEPWPALGEQKQAASRPVDSSLHRLQVHLSGLDPERYEIACNGHLMPLHPLGPGQFVAGVRFRAWQFSHILHPTVGVQSPLQFDLVDRATRRSVGSCRYHTLQPDGEAWLDFPASDAEAEQRRLSRFQSCAGDQPAFDWVRPEPNPEYPVTLDLRLAALQRL